MSSPTVPPGPDVSTSSKLVIVTSALYAVALPLYAFRMYSRLRPVQNLGWDDLVITIALPCGIVSWAFQMASVSYGLGRHNFYISPADQEIAARLLFIGQPPWAWSVALVQMSMAFMFLRFKRTTRWKIFLYAMIGLQVVVAICVNCAQFLMCRPLAGQWNPHTPNIKLWSPKVIEASVYITSTVGIVTDLIFSILPITIIRHLNRPLWERTVICCLMSLGVFASIASIVKTTLVPYYGKTGDTLWDAVDITLWSTLEEQIGMIAACIPPLKRPFELLLRRYGVVSKNESRGIPSFETGASERKESHCELGSFGTMSTNTGSGENDLSAEFHGL